MYVHRKIDEKVDDKCRKGTKKCVIAESLTFDDCKACLLDYKTIYREQMLLWPLKDHKNAHPMFACVVKHS